MAYNGYLVKVGSYTVPLKFFQYDTYVATWATNDVDSYRDAYGELHRTVLSRKTMKVEWDVPPMTNTELEEFMSNIRSQLDSTNSATVQAFMPQTNSYKSDKCYLASTLNFQIRAIYRNSVEYDAVRIAFIGYSQDSAV